MERAYYNDNDPYVAQWLGNLVAAGHLPQGTVDARSILEIQPDELRSFRQCHFFAGIGGWPLALALAEWPDDREVWTGSCPCHPFSSATRGRGQRFASEFHLWPVWRDLIAAARPRVVFGEQISQANDWHSCVGDDLEELDYAFGSAVLPACGIGLGHSRQRFFFVGYAHREGEPIGSFDDEMARLPRRRSEPRSVVRPNGISPRVAILRAFGNAIVPQVAAEFVIAAMEAIQWPPVPSA